MIKSAALLILSALAFSIFCLQDDAGAKQSDKKLLLASKFTKRFEFKEGFERRPKDIINTLKDNEVTRFQTLLEGLDQAYDLDDELKNKGPYTLFAPSDKAFKKIPYQDLDKLFANKKKLRQVLSYHIVKGKYNLDDLRKKSRLKSMEGTEIKLTNRYGNIFVDDAFLSTADVPCSNGLIQVIDHVIMPPLSK